MLHCTRLQNAVFRWQLDLSLFMNLKRQRYAGTVRLFIRILPHGTTEAEAPLLLFLYIRGMSQKPAM